MDDLAYLRAGLFAAACGRDLVLLDTRTGSYDLAPGVAHSLSVDATGRGLVLHEPSLRETLREAALLADDCGGPASLLPVLPSRSALGGPDNISAMSVVRHVAALLEMARHYYRRPLPSLIARVRAREPKPRWRTARQDLEAVQERARAFDRLVAWTPLQGACVYRSYMLRRLLQGTGVSEVKWVFGVRTWPFYAHCWLQIGDISLTDHAEALLAFSPIFAV